MEAKEHELWELIVSRTDEWLEKQVELNEKYHAAISRLDKIRIELEQVRDEHKQFTAHPVYSLLQKYTIPLNLAFILLVVLAFVLVVSVFTDYTSITLSDGERSVQVGASNRGDVLVDELDDSSSNQVEVGTSTSE